uniref:Uncharacterized protein n=1 Tax=Palpitomonas bilix TaxID=652834 RepID=A0A7S3GAU3_9EUKA|mmetsp:Transcript_42221/g.108735  ORF Transcript_42221/g.108735 Transcript_42221/m.108735 type:complete len:123 (+) Transcript_42221:127-495(+)
MVGNNQLSSISITEAQLYGDRSKLGRPRPLHAPQIAPSVEVVCDVRESEGEGKGVRLPMSRKEVLSMVIGPDLETFKHVGELEVVLKRGEEEERVICLPAGDTLAAMRTRAKEEKIVFLSYQ